MLLMHRIPCGMFTKTAHGYLPFNLLRTLRAPSQTTCHRGGSVAERRAKQRCSRRRVYLELTEQLREHDRQINRLRQNIWGSVAPAASPFVGGGLAKTNNQVAVWKRRCLAGKQLNTSDTRAVPCLFIGKKDEEETEHRGEKSQCACLFDVSVSCCDTACCWVYKRLCLSAALTQ